MFKLLLFILIFCPCLGISQCNEDYSDSRFKINEEGFQGELKADTTYYTDGKIATIKCYAIDKKLRVSGNKAGLCINYYHNGQIESQGYYDMFSARYGAAKGERRLETSYKVGLWEYFYENGQLKAKGQYQVTSVPISTGVPNQFGRRSNITDAWVFYNEDGTVASDKKNIIRDMQYNPNCE
jgi:antitoxin component YwqK of YwqJK toxin-antitoxin module